MATDPLTIEHGHIYRAKRPKRVMLFMVGDFFDDRQVKSVGAHGVQYDSATVKDGRKYPTITREKFEAWAGSDVTDGYPSGDWAEWVEK